jgi:type I restriction enzyme R subunit
VKDGFLINPTVVDARTEVTTQLLSEEGFVVVHRRQGEDSEQASSSASSKSVSSPSHQPLFCKTLSGERAARPGQRRIGKSIVFAVSQNHAAKLAQILNEMADRMFPGKYQSDFAVQVTSQIPDAQQFTINFTNNNLLGSANFLPAYKTSKARVCVTVGMMTTGYDCPDLLNLGLLRPIFSPTDFIQIKGAARASTTSANSFRRPSRTRCKQPRKTAYKLFDFFANCEYFEEEFNYDEVLKLPRPPGGQWGPGPGHRLRRAAPTSTSAPTILARCSEEIIGLEGMKIDRMFFEKFEDTVRGRPGDRRCRRGRPVGPVIDYVNRESSTSPTSTTPSTSCAAPPPWTAA